MPVAVPGPWGRVCHIKPSLYPSSPNKNKGKKCVPHPCPEEHRTRGAGRTPGLYALWSPVKASPPGAGPSTPRQPRGWRSPWSPLTSCSPRWTRRGRSGPQYSSLAAAQHGSWTPSSLCPLLQHPAALAEEPGKGCGCAVPSAPQAPGKCSQHRPLSHGSLAQGGSPGARLLVGCRLPAHPRLI